MKKYISYLGAVMTMTCSLIFTMPVSVFAAEAAGTTVQTDQISQSEQETEDMEDSSDVDDAEMRQALVAYALQFVGKPYRKGGNDPHTGADCSGFVRYVMQNCAGISMNRTSRDQAKQGTQITSCEMKPGDLLFYGSGSKINHVAMYIGDGKIVHASTERSGIKTSKWNYRMPIRIINMLG